MRGGGRRKSPWVGSAGGDKGRKGVFLILNVVSKKEVGDQNDVWLVDFTQKKKKGQIHRRRNPFSSREKSLGGKKKKNDAGDPTGLEPHEGKKKGKV